MNQRKVVGLRYFLARLQDFMLIFAQCKRMLSLPVFFISAALTACDGSRDQAPNSLPPDLTHNTVATDENEIAINRLELNFNGDWQGTWARQNSTAKLPVASRLHRDFWMPSLHYMAANGKVAGANFRQCYYDENAAGYLPAVWSYDASDTESQWLSTMRDDILIFNPIVLWSERPIEKKAEQRYSYGHSGRSTTVEVYKFSDSFMVNSRWKVEVPGYVPQGDYNACASLRWKYDENTLRLSFYSFTAVIPFTNNAGDHGEITMFFFFENTSALEKRTYDSVDEHVAQDDPGLSIDSVTVKYGPRVTQIRPVEEAQLTVTHIGTDVVDIRISGQLPDDTTFLASGKVYITPDGWLPH